MSDMITARFLTLAECEPQKHTFGNFVDGYVT